MKTRRASVVISFVFGLGVVACHGSSPTGIGGASDAGQGGSTGDLGTGGIAMGGITGGGGKAIGGASPKGGISATGGAPATGATLSTGIVPATGGASASGGASATAGATATCGVTATGPTSCQGSPALCCQGESCCTSLTVPGNTTSTPFKMGRSGVSTASDYYSGGGSDEVPEHDAIVATYDLDKYEVTVGRFRKFVAAYDAWHATASPQNPIDNAGAHPIAANTGWGRSWTASSKDLPADSTALVAALKCNASYNPSYHTWNDDPTAGYEAYPINCVSWYTAFAFCIWDGGRLPTEAEWEYAAAGGSNNYLYPWGSAAPSSNLADFDTCTGCISSPFVAVGSYQPAGNARWGHADLAGSMWEWVFDWYLNGYYGATSVPVACDNCANSGDFLTHRVIRGGAWYYGADPLRAAERSCDLPSQHNPYHGFRCARTGGSATTGGTISTGGVPAAGGATGTSAMTLTEACAKNCALASGLPTCSTTTTECEQNCTTTFDNTSAIEPDLGRQYKEMMICIATNFTSSDQFACAKPNNPNSPLNKWSPLPGSTCEGYICEWTCDDTTPGNYDPWVIVRCGCGAP
jgi:sulfatase modifying factor 1